MAPRKRRFHGQEGVGSLASMPLDAGGVAHVAHLRATLEASGVKATVVRPTLSGGATPQQPSLALANVPTLESLSEERASDAPRAGFEYDGATVRAQIAFDAPVQLYGGGQAAGNLLRTGRALELWNTDSYRYGEHTPALYSSHPFALALRSDGSCVGVLADSIRRGVVRFASDGVEFAFEDEPFDVWLLEGAHPRDVLRALTELTGRIELPPLWSLGYHQCRWSYMDEAEVRELARKLRSKHIPCDAIWLDIDHMDRQRSFTWDAARFPDPTKLIADLREQGFRVVATVDPGLAVARGYAPYDSGLAGAHFVLDAAGTPAKGRVWPGICHFPDFTRGATRDWWAGLVESFAACGVAGLWNDMNEPSVFRTPTRTLPMSAQHRGLGGGTHAKFHNLYGQLMAQATREGLLDAQPTERPFVLTRASHGGGARFAATWTGDNQATWDDLRWSIPMVLSLGLSGQPFSGADIGGFDGDPSGELFARWFELGAYLPFARGHSDKSACRKEPWSFGGEIERAVKAALERRMQLMPTLYTLFHEAAASGAPIARPMFFADARDPALRDVDDQFMLGADLVVAPVVHEGATKREVLLPPTSSGGWFLFPDGVDLLAPGRYTIDAPLGRTPVFARAGSIIATKPSKLHTGAQLGEELELHVFFDARQRAVGRLYEDDGVSRGERGVKTELSAKVMRGRVVIDAFADGEEVLERAWRVHAHGLAKA